MFFPVLARIRPRLAIVSPPGGFADQCLARLVHAGAVSLGGCQRCQRSVVEHAAMDQVGEAQPVLGVPRQTTVQIGRALAHVIATFQYMLGRPTSGSAIARPACCDASRTSFVGPIVVAGVPVASR